MMLKEKIENYFKQYQDLKILFFFDSEDQQYKEEIDQFNSDSIKLVTADKKYFTLKYQLEYEFKNDKILLYFPFPKPIVQHKFPLLDLLLANKELLLDPVNEFMEEYKLPTDKRDLVRKYIKSLDTKTNRKRLEKILDASNFNEESLKSGLISSVLDFENLVDSNLCIAKLMIISNDEEKLIQVIKKLKSLDLDTKVLHWLKIAFDINASELTENIITEAVFKFKYNLITADIAKVLLEDDYKKFKIEIPAVINKIKSLYLDWTNYVKLSKDIETVFNSTGSDVNDGNILDIYGISASYGYYSEQMNYAAINYFNENILKNPAKISDEIIPWFDRTNDIAELNTCFSLLYHSASMFSILEKNKTYLYNKLEDYIEKYKNELFKIDYHYRKSLTSLKDIKSIEWKYKEQDFSAIEKELHQKYENFTVELNVEWLKILNENNFNYAKIPVEKQFNFFKDNFKSFDAKVVVIISDALRYEVANEIADELLKNSKNVVELKIMLSSIPSYTALGMANLLPHKKIDIITAGNDPDYMIDGISSSTLEGRKNILKKHLPDSDVIDYKDVVKLDQTQGRAKFNNQRVVYIYHNKIDSISDTRKSEYMTVETVQDTVKELTQLIRTLNNWNVYYVYLTSDHGFLYNQNDLKPSYYEDFPVSQEPLKEHNRFVLSKDKITGNGYSLDLSSTTDLQTDIKVFLPMAINRYRKQGSGSLFVHGGGSLQEIVVPVLQVMREKIDKKNYVKFKVLNKELTISAGFLKFNILQEQALNNELKAINLIVGLYSESNQLISNEEYIELNSTSQNPKERLNTITLTLTSQASKLNICDLIIFNADEKNKLNPLIKEKITINTIIGRDF